MRILRLVSTRPLSCGCTIGIYETYNGPLVSVIQERATRCASPAHRAGSPVTAVRPADTPPVQQGRSWPAYR